MLPCHSCNIYGVWRSKEVGRCFKAIICGGKESHRWVVALMENEGSHYVPMLYWNFIVNLPGYSKIFYRISLFTVLLLFYLFCIHWDWWQGQKCNLKCPTVTSMRLTLNYSIFTVISACMYLCHTTSLNHSLIRMHLLQLKIHNVWMEYFWNQTMLHLDMKKTSALKS